MKFLIFQHVHNESPGFISDWAKKRNIKLDIIKVWKPYKAPPIGKHDALIVMGGPMEVYHGPDKYPSKEDELNFIKKAMGKIPIIGFCLGSQLLAHSLGADVHKNIINGKWIKEIGFYHITLTKEGLKNPIFKGFPPKIKVLQWHGGAFDLPKKSILLATSPLCQNQVFSYKNAFGFLCHFEFTPQMIKTQIKNDRKWIHEEFDMDEKKLLREAEEYKILMKSQCFRFMDSFLANLK